MAKFSEMLRRSFEARGHAVQVWSPRPFVYKAVSRFKFAKWGVYIDQYILFPIWVRRALMSTPLDTLFVFCDQALGPWVPLVQNRPHVVHVHDLTALRCALGDLVQNPLSFTGKVYQRYIRRGFRRGHHFISVSNKTRADLHEFGKVNAETSVVVYNGLNFPYSKLSYERARTLIKERGLPTIDEGMILHVGGGQWYKNLPGVIAIYAHYSAQTERPLPLWCISPPPNKAVKAEMTKIHSNGRIYFFTNLNEQTLQAIYSCAHVLLFPSFAEGFGWPLVEALACGCPVITTDAPPMNEFTGNSARYLPILKSRNDMDNWASRGSVVLQEVLSQPAIKRVEYSDRSVDWARRFDQSKAIDSYLSTYVDILERQS
jgi:glycosyltransferase involved in cell wall biosynthesis